MDIDQFYKMDSDSSFIAELIDEKQPDFDHHKLIEGNYEGIKFPVYLKHYLGTKKLRDILHTDFCAKLISEKLKNILEENHITGWKTYPIKLFYKRMIPIEGYYGLSVVGRCGPIDYSKSKIVKCVQPDIGYTFKAYKGLYIGLDKWDGSDFFFPEGTQHTIVTQRVVDILKDFSKQIEFTNLADQTTDCTLVKI